MARQRSTLPHVKRVKAKGTTYFYFDTGAVKNGQPVRVRLPDITSKHFGTAYAAQLGARTKRLNILPVVEVAKLIADYQRSKEFIGLSDSTRKTYNVYLGTIERLIGVAPANEIARKDVLAMLDSMADRPGAANMTLGVFSSLYAWGRSREIVSIDPAKDIPMFAKRDYEPWPEGLVAEALASDDALIRTLVGLLYFTAQRIGDVSKMRWSHVKSDVVFVRQQKTGRELEIELHPDLLLILGARPNQDRTILAKADGSPISSETLRTRLQAWARGKGHKVVPHGLRKNAVNALLEAGCTVAETSAVSGQSLGMVEFYAKKRSVRKLAKSAIGKMQAPRSEVEQ